MEKKGFDAKTQWINQKWERTEEKNTVIYVNVPCILYNCSFSKSTLQKRFMNKTSVTK